MMTMRWIVPSMMLVLTLLLGSALKLNEFHEANTEVNEVICWSGEGYLVDKKYCEGLRDPIGDETVGETDSFHKTRFVGTLAQLKDIERQNPTAQP